MKQQRLLRDNPCPIDEADSRGVRGGVVSVRPSRARNYCHFTTITMRWGDNDAYGHVNTTIYYAWSTAR